MAQIREPEETVTEALKRHLSSSDPASREHARNIAAALEDARAEDGPLDPETEELLKLAKQ
jgi:hypothetical protein